MEDSEAEFGWEGGEEGEFILRLVIDLLIWRSWCEGFEE